MLHYKLPWAGLSKETTFELCHAIQDNKINNAEDQDDLKFKLITESQ